VGYALAAALEARALAVLGAGQAREAESALRRAETALGHVKGEIHLDRAICIAQDGDGRNAISHAAKVLDALSVDQRKGIISARAIDAEGWNCY
jgi:hypothetical protein